MFAIGPAPATYIALGLMLDGGPLLGVGFARGALVLGVAFAAAGLIAVFATACVILTVVHSVVQEASILAAAATLLQSRDIDRVDPPA